MSKPRVYTVVAEMAIGALAQELLPVFLEKTRGELMDGRFVRVHLDIKNATERAFAAAEHFLVWRDARLRAAEVNTQAALSRRAKPKRKPKR